MAIKRDLVAASAAPLILSILAEGENYGYAIIKRVADLSGGAMQWTDGMLYPVLHRLEQQKLIRSFERISEQGRRRRYYKLNKRGAKALSEQKNQWMLVHSTLRRLWEKKPCLT